MPLLHNDGVGRPRGMRNEPEDLPVSSILTVSRFRGLKPGVTLYSLMCCRYRQLSEFVGIPLYVTSSPSGALRRKIFINIFMPMKHRLLLRLLPLLLFGVVAALPLHAEWSADGTSYYMRTTDGYDKEVQAKSSFTFSENPSASSFGYKDNGVSFTPANAGEVIVITLEECDLENGNYLLVYDGVVEELGKGGLSDGVEQSRYLPAGWKLKLTKADVGKTYISQAESGALTIAMHTGSAPSSKLFKFKVESVVPKDMEYVGATAVTGLAGPRRGAAAQVIAAFDVETSGISNALSVEALRINATESTSYSNLALRYGGETIATYEAGGLTIASPVKLSSGHNIFEVVADMQPDASGNLPAPVMVTLKVGGVERGTIPAPSPAVANVIYMPVGPAVYTISGETPFYDDGGPDANVTEQFSGTITFVPATAGSSIKVDVTKLDLFNTNPSNNDQFKFYSGRTADADNLITTLLTQPKFVKSTAADGSMTVEFKSTTGITKPGFEAVVSTFVPGPMTVSAVNSELPLAAATTVSAGENGVKAFIVDVMTDNTGDPLKATELKLSSELPAALSGVKLYYLGESSAATPGQAIATANGAASMSLQFEKELLEGHNYFLVTLDIAANVVNGDAVKLALAGVTVGGNSVVPSENTQLSLTVKNVCASTEGTHSHDLNGAWDFVPTMDGTKYAGGTTDQIVTFKPVTPGTIAQISFSDFHVYYSSSPYYGARAVFEIYSGSTCDEANLLWKLTDNSQQDLGPQGVLRSRAADGSLTIRFNPNSSASYYTAEGWHAQVSEFLNHDMTIIGSEVRQTSTGAAPVGASDIRLIDFTINAEGTLSVKNVKSVKLALTGHEAISTVKVYASQSGDRSGATLFGSAQAAAEVNVQGDFSLAEGANYMWVEADVKADAQPETVIDATLKSLTDAKGVTTDIANGNPEGTLTVKLMLVEAEGSHVVDITRTIMFYDDGGADGKIGSVIGSSKKATYTFVPVGDNKAIKISSQAFSIGNGNITFYNGREVNEANVLGNITGYSSTNGPAEPLVSRAADGTITMTIKNPTGKTLDGFALEISLHEKQPFALGDIAADKCLLAEKIVRGATQVPLTRVKVDVDGDKGDCTVDEMTFDISDATVSSASLYYGGDADNFNVNIATLLSTAVPVDGKVTLSAGNETGGNGTCYYYLVGDVKADAAVDAAVTSCLKSVKFNGTSTTADVESQSLAVRAGLAAGTYSVGAGKDYETIAAATAALANGIEGPVTVEIADGIYKEYLILEDIQGTSETSPLVIKSASGNNNAVTLKPTRNAGDNLVMVDHTPWVTIEGITIDATGESFDSAVLLNDRSHHFTLKDCAVSGDRPTNYSGIELFRSFDSTEETALINKYSSKSGNGLNNDYVTVVDNVFTGGKDAVYLAGTGKVANRRHIGAVVTGNTIVNPSAMGVYVNAIDDAVVKNNNVQVSEKGYSDVKGIAFNSARNFSCVDNKVAITLSGKYSTGIRVYTKSGGYDGKRSMIANNDIVITHNQSYGYGMQVDNDSRDIDVVYNTIRNGGDGGYLYATASSGNPVGMVFANNLLQNDVQATSNNAGTTFVLYFSSATDVDGYTVDHNAMYAANGQLLKLSSEKATDIETFNTKVNDAANTNLVEQAKFADVTNQHLLEKGTSLATARAIDGVKTDRDGRERPAEGATVGAYEYVPLSTEAPALAEGYPVVSGLTENSADVKTKWTVAGKLYAKTIEWSDAATAPTADELLDCEAVITDANVELVTKAIGLKPETAYRTFLCSVSVLGNASEVVSTETFTTLRHIDPLQLAVAPVSIEAGNEATVEVGIAGGDEPYTIEWRDRMNNVIGAATTVTVTPEMSQPYYVSVSSADGQTATAKAPVIVKGDFFPATVDDNYIAPDGILAPGDDADALYSGSLAFNGATMWWGTSSYWNGYTFSAQQSAEFTGLTDQYRSAPGGGYDSNNFVVAFPENYSIDVTNTESGVNLTGTMITNSAYSYSSMNKGDGYAKKFAEGDWFKLTVTGHHADGTTSALDFYLADMRSSEPSEQYILGDWTWLDLRGLGDVVKLTFALDSSDKSYGYINTPSYFCLDNIGQLPTGEEFSKTLNYGETLPLAQFFETADADTDYSIIDCSNAEVTPMLQLADGIITIDSGENDQQLDFDIIIAGKNVAKTRYATVHVTRLAREPGVGLGNVSVGEGVVLYPVPVTEVLNVATALEDYDVEIFATDGTLAMASRGLSGNASIERGALASGVYIVRVMTADGAIATVKRIIIR